MSIASSSSSFPYSPYDTKDVIALAEVLGASLTANIKGTLQEAVAMEAKLWRADALSILEKLQADICCRFAHSDFEEGAITHSSPGLPMATILSEGSDTSRASSLRRSTSIERQFAADVFTASFGRPTSEPKAQNDSRVSPSATGATQFGRCASAESARSRMRSRFEPIVRSDTLHSNLEGGSGGTSRSLKFSCARGSREHPSSVPGEGNTLQTNFSRSTSQASGWESLASTMAGASSEEPANAPGHEDPCDFQSSLSRNGSAPRWKEEANVFFYRRSTSDDEAQRQVRSMISTVFCGLGIIPWCEQRLLLSRMYQFACLFCLVASTLGVVTQSFLDVSPSEEEAHEPMAHYIDVTVAVATLLSFIATLWNRNALQDTCWLIESYLSRAGHLDDVDNKACMDILILLFIWSASLGARLYATGSTHTLSDFAFALSLFVLLAICFCASRICCCLFYMVELFCCYMQDNADFVKALQEFFLLHCTIRTVCSSLQLCFVVLQLAATVLFLVCSAEVYMGRMQSANLCVHLTPGVLCILVLLQLSLRAGAVTDHCARVPMLVNSFNAKLDIRRMCVVDYIVYSQVGFDLFEVRLNTATVLKLSYVAFVAWCGVLTQGMI